jgi:hypothetical protein
MFVSELKLVESALGARTLNALAEVACEPSPDAWTGLAVAVTLATFQEIPASPRVRALVQALWVKAGYGPPQPQTPCDEMVTGRVGNNDLSRGCFSFFEVWTMAAREIARTGRARQAETALASGTTVRALLRTMYGVKAGPEWDEASEGRAFLRTLRRAQQAESN